MARLILVVLAAMAVVSQGARKVEEEKKPDFTITHEAWFDIEIKDYDGPGEDYRGRFVVGLFGEQVPMTVLNFVKLANGFQRKKADGRVEKLHYKNTIFHRLVTDFVIQGGDVTVGDGSGGKSIFGDKFNDESFTISHNAAGYLAMANHGKDTNGSQFFILLNRARWLDDKHVVFGKIIQGMDVLRDMGEIKTFSDSRPRNRIKIVDCGADPVEKKYTLSEEEARSEKDLTRD
ncbi:peptidyl-prolyl cis-trans isomerase B-like [Liolophura sinensis]|uniref:peptidyl-prolyl cis-trans isomerase B-like n=1 Tax=Liolophura sinensis TaxID=3198878 RepID=UPI003158E21C